MKMDLRVLGYEDGKWMGVAQDCARPTSSAVRESVRWILG
jgi:hypothetical protein